MSKLSEQFELLKKDLITAYDRKGMRASGDFANSLEVVMLDNGTKAQLWGNSYAQQLETGRQSGKFPPISMIEKWIDDKNISARLNGEITKSQLAFLIARKIAREGWKREGFGGVELISEVITEERIKKIIDEVGVEQAFIYQTQIISLIKEMAT
jgi:hypothetical protein